MFIIYFANGKVMQFPKTEMQELTYRDGDYMQFVHKGTFYFIPYTNLLYFTE